IAVIIDEFGKFLEHLSIHPSQSDVFVLQSLAEGAARSPGRMFLLTIQHTSFADYFTSTSAAFAREWQKVQGRFTDEAFHLPAPQMLELIGMAIRSDWPDSTAALYGSYVERVWSSNALTPVRERGVSQASLLA